MGNLFCAATWQHWVPARKLVNFIARTIIHSPPLGNQFVSSLYPSAANRQPVSTSPTNLGSYVQPQGRHTMDLEVPSMGGDGQSVLIQ